MEHAGLGGDQDVAIAGGAGGIEHSAGRQHMGTILGKVAVAGQPQGAGRAATLGVDVEVGLGIGLDLVTQLGGGDVGVHVALAHPDVDVVASGHAAHMGTEELVRTEEDLLVGR